MEIHSESPPAHSLSSGCIFVGILMPGGGKVGNVGKMGRGRGVIHIGFPTVLYGVLVCRFAFVDGSCFPMGRHASVWPKTCFLWQHLGDLSCGSFLGQFWPCVTFLCKKIYYCSTVRNGPVYYIQQIEKACILIKTDSWTECYWFDIVQKLSSAKNSKHILL